MMILSVAGIVFAQATGVARYRLAIRDPLPPAEAGRTLDLAVLFFRIFSLQMFFYGISTIGTGVLQAHRHFFLPTFAPVLNNLMVIASFIAYALLVVTPTRPLALNVLAVGVTAGLAVMARRWFRRC